MNQPLRLLGRHALDQQSLAPPLRARNVFLHGMWRSGSTYVWSRFRQAKDAYCYYEPLAPGLDRLTRARIPRDTPQMMVANRHPVLERPYFAEFAPLLGLRGVKGFRRRFIFDDFVLSPADARPALAAYIERLAGHAADQACTGVFGFNQTGLRIGWLGAQMEGCNIQIERDPRDIWASYMEHRQRGNFTYFRNWLLILERNASHPLLAPLAERLPLRRGASRLIKAKRFYAQAAQEMPAADLYLLVVYMWMACALHAASTCDLILDVNLADRRGYGLLMSARVAAHSGLHVDFDDLRSPPAATDYTPVDFGRIEQDAARLFPKADIDDLVHPQALARRQSELTPRKLDLLHRALG